MHNSISMLILGFIQGLTEFLPVSSSGHLVIFEHFLKFEKTGVVFDVILHFGTAMSVVAVFWKRIIALIKSFFGWKKDDDFYLACNIILANIPVGIIGITGMDKFFKSLFSFNFVIMALVVNGFMLISTFFIKSGNKPISTVKAIVIGIFQCFAVTPGISRSGSTIFGALLGKISPAKAFEFSFLLSLPVIIGATLKECIENKEMLSFDAGLLGALIISFVSGIFALKLLKNTVVKGRLYYFGIYTLILSLILIFFRR